MKNSIWQPAGSELFYSSSHLYKSAVSLNILYCSNKRMNIPLTRRNIWRSLKQTWLMQCDLRCLRFDRKLDKNVVFANSNGSSLRLTDFLRAFPCLLLTRSSNCSRYTRSKWYSQVKCSNVTYTEIHRISLPYSVSMIENVMMKMIL